MGQEIAKMKVVYLPQFEKAGDTDKPITIIPHVLNDPHLKKAVEFNPVGEVSVEFGNALISTYNNFKQVDDSYVSDKSKYVILPTYRKDSVSDLLDKLSPEQRDQVVEIVNSIIAGTYDDGADAIADLNVRVAGLTDMLSKIKACTAIKDVQAIFAALPQTTGN